MKKSNWTIQQDFKDIATKFSCKIYTVVKELSPSIFLMYSWDRKDLLINALKMNESF